MSIVLLVVGILLFIGLVVVHEWGHFLAAKRSGVVVEEFGIGFPPRLFAMRTKGGWLFTINILPLGGFVKLKGEHDADTEAGSFGAASVRAKAGIMIAGVFMNLVVAYVLLTFLALVGLPQLVGNQFMIHSDAHYVQRASLYIGAGAVEPASPAYAAGIRANDGIVAIGPAGNMQALTSVNALPNLTRQYAGRKVEIAYKHNNSGTVIDTVVVLRTAAQVTAAKAAGKQIGYLGVTAYQGQTGIDVIRSTWSAPIVAAGVIKQFTVLTFSGLGKALVGLGGTVAGLVTGNNAARQASQTEASSQVAGPVGIFFVLKYGSTLGYRFVLLIIAVLSLTLAIMNILPIPALDGGRFWLMLLMRAVRRTITPEREELVNAVGFVFLMGLVILVTVVDVKRFF